MPWNQVECHPHVKQILLSLIAANKMGGTHLIYGPPQAGQLAVAEAIALTLNCKNQSNDFCGQCINCKRIIERQFPDVFVLHPSEDWYKPERKGQDYSIDHMRMVQEYAQSLPYESQYKIFIVQDAHRMQDPSANSLLKILEEPHPHVVFLLLTDNLFRILPTVISRCNKIRLLPLDTQSMIQTLSNEIPPAMAETLARASGGIPQQARDYFNENFIEYRDEMLNTLIQINDNKSVISEVSESWAKKGRDTLRQHLNIIITLMRDALLLKRGNLNGPFFNPDAIDILKRYSEPLTEEGLLSGMEKMIQLFEGLDRNINIPLQIVDALMEIYSPQSSAI